LNSKIAIVTGITGYVGRAVAKRLFADGWKVHGVVRPQSEINELEMFCEIHVHDGSTEHLVNIFQEIKPYIVFHISSHIVIESSPNDVLPLIQSNILFASQLLEASINSECHKFINTGTYWQHYYSDGYQAVNLYAATKQAFESILSYYANSYNLSVLTLKLFDIYGSGDTRRKLVNLLVNAIKTGCSLEMTKGEQVVDITYIDDIVQGYIISAALLRQKNGYFNETYFLSGERLKVKDIVGFFSEIAGNRLSVTFGVKPYRQREIMFPIDPGERVLPGWIASTNLRKAIPFLLDGFSIPSAQKTECYGLKE